MAIGKVVKYWEARPPSGTPIDRNNPLTRGLVYADSLVQMRDGIQPTRVGTKPQVQKGIQARGFGTTLGVGTTDSIEAPFNRNSLTRTYLIRMLKNGQGGGNLGRAFDNHGAGAGGGFLISASATTIQYQQYYSGQDAISVITVPNSQFVNIAVTVDSRVVDATAIPLIYINGILQTPVSTATPTGTITDTSLNFVIGNRHDGVRVWDGLLSDFMVFDRVLTQAEIKAYSDNPYQIYEPIDVYYINVGAGGAFSIDAQVGAFALAGVNANLVKGRVLDCNTGTFALAGQNADLLKSKLILSVAGAFSLAGQNADLEYTPNPSNYSIDALPGAFVLTGISATILKSKAIDANTGAFTLTGVNATLARGRVLDANAGAFALSGIDASLLKSKSIDAVAGAFTMTGRIASLEYSGAPEVDNNPMKPVSILVYSQLGAK